MAINPAIFAKYGGADLATPSAPASKAGIDPAVLAKYSSDLPQTVAPASRPPDNATVEVSDAYIGAPDTGGPQYDKGDTVGETLSRPLEYQLFHLRTQQEILDEIAAKHPELKPEMDARAKTIESKVSHAVLDAGAMILNSTLGTPGRIAMTGGLIATGGLSEAVPAIAPYARTALATAGAYFAKENIKPAQDKLVKLADVAMDPKSDFGDITAASIDAGVPVSTVLLGGAGVAGFGPKGVVEITNKILPEAFYKNTGLTKEQFATAYPEALDRFKQGKATDADTQLMQMVNEAATVQGVSKGAVAKGNVPAEVISHEPTALTQALPAGLRPLPPARPGVVFEGNAATPAEALQTPALTPGAQTPPEAPPEPVEAVSPPPPTPAPKGGIVASIEGLEGKSGPGSNAAINEELMKAPVPTVAPAAMPAPAPTMPVPATPQATPQAPATPAPNTLPTEAVAKLSPDQFLDYVRQATPPEQPYVPPEVPRKTEGAPLTIHDVSKLDGPAFQSYVRAAEAAGGGASQEADEMGLAAYGNKDAIEELALLKQKAHEEFIQAMRDARKGSDDPAKQDALAQNAQALGTKIHFFSEAFGAATNTGSAGEFLTKEGRYNDLTPPKNEPAKPTPAQAPAVVLAPRGPAGANLPAPAPGAPAGLPVPAPAAGSGLPVPAPTQNLQPTQLNAPVPTTIPVRAPATGEALIVKKARAKRGLPAPVGTGVQAAGLVKPGKAGRAPRGALVQPAGTQAVPAKLQPVGGAQAGLSTEAAGGTAAKGTKKSAVVATAFVLPKELAGAKPRYAYGADQFQLDFRSDLDKAVYILAQKTPSKSDAKYLKAVTEQTGMTPAQARAAGQIVKSEIKKLSRGQDSITPLKVPSITQLPTTQPHAVQKQVPAEVDVQPAPANGQAVGQAHPENLSPAGEGGGGAGGGEAPSGQEPNAANAPARAPKLSETELAVGGAQGPPKPPIEVPRVGAAGEEPEPEKTPEERHAELVKAVAKGYRGSVDVASQRAISQIIQDTLGGDINKAKDLPANAVQALIDQINEEARVGRLALKTRVDRRRAIHDNLMEMMTEERATSNAINPRPIERERLTRINPVARLREAIGNGYARAVTKAIKYHTYLNTRDVELNFLSGNKNYGGFLSRYLGGDIDRNYNAKLSMARGLRENFKRIIREVKPDEVSLNRIGAYALARQGLSSRVLESGVRPSELTPGKGIGPKELLKLTPGEQKIYDEWTRVRDIIGPKVQALMHNLFNVDMELRPDYSPLQRDWDLYQPKPDQPEIKLASGDTISQELANSFSDLFSSFIPSTTTHPNRGFTIERQEGAKGPAVLNFAQSVEQYINRSTHLLANAEDLMKWGKIARTNEFAQQYGTIGQKYATDLLDTVARNSNPLGTHGAKWIDGMTSNLNVAILGWRLLSQLKHTTNIATAIRLISSKNLMRGMTDAATGDATQFLRDNAEAVMNRYGGEQAIMDMNGKLGKAQRFTFAIERGVDAYLSRGAWLGAYLDRLDKLGMDTTNYLHDPPHDPAMRRADVINRKIVTSPLLQDVSQALSRNKMSMNNATLRKMQFALQSTMLSQASNYTQDVLGEGFKTKNYLGAGAALMAATAILAGEIFYTDLNRELKAWIVRQATGGNKEAKQPPIAHEVVRDMTRRVPVVGPFAATTKDSDVGIPAVANALLVKDSLRHVLSGKDSLNRPLSSVQIQKAKIDLASSILSFTPLGIGATTIGEFAKASLPQPAPAKKGNW